MLVRKRERHEGLAGVRRSAALALVVVGVIAQAHYGDGPLAMTLGWAFSGHTPLRVVPLPVTLIVPFAVASFLAKGWAGLSKPINIARIVVATAFVDLLSAVVTMQLTPLVPELRGAYAAYIAAARLTLLAGAGAIAVLVVRHRDRELILLAATLTVCAIGVLRLVLVNEVLPLIVLATGSAGAILYARSTLRLTQFLIPRGARAEIAVVALVTLGGLALRIMFTVLLSSTLGPDYPRTSDDGPTYDELARLLASGDDTGRSTYFFNLYPATLSVLYRLFGANYLAVGIIQSIYAASVIPAAYILVRLAAGRIVATIVAVALTVDSVLLFLAPVLAAESLFVATFAWSLACLALIPQAGSWWRLVLATLAGLLVGLGVATRDVLTLFPLVAAAWIVWALSRSSRGERRVALTVGLFFLATLIVVLPFNAYRSRTSLYGSSTGLTYVVVASHSEFLDLGVRPEEGFEGVLAAAQRDPGRFIAAVAGQRWHEADLFLFSSWFSLFDPVLLVQRTSYALSVEAYMLSAGLLGAILWLRRGPGIEARLLAALGIGYLTFMYVVVFAASGALRYRAAVDLVLLSFVALGLVALVGALRFNAVPTFESLIKGEHAGPRPRRVL